MKNFINSVLFNYLNEIEKQNHEMQKTLNPIKKGRLQSEILTKTRTYGEIRELFNISLNADIEKKQKQYQNQLKILFENCPTLEKTYST